MKNNQDKQEERNLKYQLSTDNSKQYDSPPSIRQQSEDIIVFDKILMSLKKLGKIINKEQIQTFFDKFIQSQIWIHHMFNLDFELQSQTVMINSGLQIIPRELLIGVFEYQGVSYNFNRKKFNRFYAQQKFSTVKSFDQIAHINFINLKQLSILKQSINNIQALSFLNAPNLQFIDLYENHVVQINSLTKADFKSLEGINLTKNPIKQIEKFSRLQFFKLLPQFLNLKDTQIYKSNVCKKQNMIEKNYIENFKLFFKLQMPEDILKRNTEIFQRGNTKQNFLIQANRQDEFQLIGYSDMRYGQQ